ncbi:HEPN domain-containing protein [Pedobacter cryophilus]|nr:HEPN domain-containing protein [Pedobacter cryophilus]
MNSRSPYFGFSNATFSPLKPMLTQMIHRYQPVWIICFAYRLRHQESYLCFNEQQLASDHHYFLLMVTKGRTRFEHEAQDFVTTHFTEGEITLLSHGSDTIAEKIIAQHKFFTRVLNFGTILYAADGMGITNQLPYFNPAELFEQTEKCFYNRLEMAKGFLEGAAALLKVNYEANAVFLLHQSVEQACAALIRVFLAYRSDIHHLGRLLKLCLCFTEELLTVFPQNSLEEKRLFDLLQKSYSEARYRDGFIVSAEEAEILLKKVGAFLQITIKLCEGKLEEMRNVH